MKLNLLFCTLLLSAVLKAQTPSQINYQGVARDGSGSPIIGTLDIKFELRQGTATSATVFTEEQSVTTGSLGVFSTQIGKTSGATLSSINWQAGNFFLEVSLKIASGTYTSIGVQQLVSVPYAMYAQSVPASYTNNVLTIGSQAFTLSPATGALYTAGTGISISSASVITNTSPDLPVTFTSSSSNITINGSYPNFGISYTSSPSPATLTLSGANNNSLSAGSNTISLNTYTAGSGISITGGPNYTISSSASNPTITGSGLAVVNPTVGNTFNVSVPNPSITISNTLLTLTQGTAVSTATINPPTLALSGTNNNSLSAGNNTVVLNTYTAGAGVSITGGPNYTISSSAASPTINAAGVAVVSPTTGTNFTVTVPNPNVVVSNTLLTLTQGASTSTTTINNYTVGAGLSMSGGPNYTISSSAASPTINAAGVAVVSPTTGSNFTVTVPNPSVVVSNTLLTLTQGASTSTTTINNYTVGAGLSMSGGPNYTISSSAANPTINAVGVAVVSPTTGSNFTVTVPNPSVVVSNTLLTLTQGASTSTTTINNYTVGAGLTMSGGPNYTISSSASNPTVTGTGIAQVTPTTGSNFVVNVPVPSISSTGSLLTLTQGTAVSTATIDPPVLNLIGANNNSLSAGGNTVVLNTYTAGAGLLISGGPDFTISATASNPTITGSGVAVVSPSTGTNFNITVSNPALSVSSNTLTITQGTAVSNVTLPTTTVTATGVASISGGGLSYNVDVPSPNYNALTGALITGTSNTNITPVLTFTNNILTAGPASNSITIPASINTSIFPAGTASVSGSFPSFTISAPPSPSIAGTGLAIVSPSTGANITVNVPLLTYTPSTGVLASGTNSLNITSPISLIGTTLTSGAVSNSVDISSVSPFTSSGANIFQTTLSNSVGIGTNAPTAKLDVTETAAYTGALLKVRNINSANTSNMVDISSTGTGNVLNVFSNNSSTATPAGFFDGGLISKGKTATTSGYAFRAQNSSANDLFVVRNDGNVGVGTLNPSALLQVVNSSLSDGISADITNVANGSNALQIRHFGLGNAAFFQVANSAGAIAIEAQSNSNTQNTIKAVSSTTNTGIYAGYFDGGLVTKGKNNLNSAFALRVQNSSASDLLAVLNDGNVGIGTNSPATKLHLHSSTSNFVQVRLTHTATATFGFVVSSDNLSSAILNYDNTPLFFGTNGANRMVVSASGSVGIGPGAMSPAARLDVSGTFKITDGTEGVGKVLTSDANGNATWQNSGVPSGAIMAYGGATIPAGWVVCDGSAISRTGANASLFAAIGTAWGAGNGTTTFNVPDMRGMFLRGVASGSTSDPDRSTRVASNTGGNTGDNVGSRQTDEFAIHNHSITNLGSTTLGGLGLGTTYAQTGSTNTNNAGGSTETRPKNVYVYYMIKL